MHAQREERFAKNRQRLNTKGFKHKFPDESKQPRQLKDILNYYKMATKADDLIKLMKGEACSENLINLYFKILEKINFMMQ